MRVALGRTLAELAPHLLWPDVPIVRPSDRLLRSEILQPGQGGTDSRRPFRTLTGDQLEADYDADSISSSDDEGRLPASQSQRAYTDAAKWMWYLEEFVHPDDIMKKFLSLLESETFSFEPAIAPGMAYQEKIPYLNEVIPILLRWEEEIENAAFIDATPEGRSESDYQMLIEAQAGYRPSVRDYARRRLAEMHECAIAADTIAAAAIAAAAHSLSDSVGGRVGETAEEHATVLVITVTREQIEAKARARADKDWAAATAKADEDWVAAKMNMKPKSKASPGGTWQNQRNGKAKVQPTRHHLRFCTMPPAQQVNSGRLHHSSRPAVHQVNSGRPAVQQVDSGRLTHGGSRQSNKRPPQQGLSMGTCPSQKAKGLSMETCTPKA